MNRAGKYRDGHRRQEMKDYYLGRLSPEEASALEVRYLSNENTLEELFTAREALIEAYVRGKLAAEDRVRFERYFLTTPERNEEVAVVRALLQEAKRPTSGWGLDIAGAAKATIPRWWREILGHWGGYRWAVTTFILFCAGGLWVSQQWLRDRPLSLESKIEQSPSKSVLPPQNTFEESTPSDQLVKRAAPATQTEVLTISLFPTLLRDEALPKFRILSTTRLLKVRLILEKAIGESESQVLYSVTLQNDAGRSVWRGSGYRARLNNSAAIVRIDLPAQHLKSGEYLLQLSAEGNNQHLTEPTEYAFQVERK